MNCPSRVDQNALENEGYNQSPPALALHKRDDLNARANQTKTHDHCINALELSDQAAVSDLQPDQKPKNAVSEHLRPVQSRSDSSSPSVDTPPASAAATSSFWSRSRQRGDRFTASAWKKILKYMKFVGPGFMVAVAYIDPGNYATDVAAGASYRFKLLVMVLISNIIAIFLQSLCIKLGSVTGMNLAENIKAHCPPWLNYFLWFLAECAIIATDIAEVLGTAIALKLLLNIPLVAGCAISIVDVLIILIFYRPSGTMRGLRLFEVFVALLVIGVVVCFIVQLSLIYVPDIGTLFRGYLPSDALVESQGLYQACGILGATVMPHSLYLGSGLVQPRLREYDVAHNNVPDVSGLHEDEQPKYRPTKAAIKSCMSYSIAELAISLFTFALFVNSSILIVAGATLYGTPEAADADLFSIHDLFSRSLAPFAGTVFALALLLSGTSAGIVCTIAGQMVSEGQLGWAVKPWVRRLIVRSISITPSIIVAGAVGQHGVSAALTASQVALSVLLPFVSAPLIYFTCRSHIMSVEDPSAPTGRVNMRNGWFVGAWGIVLWLLICVMNVALIVLAAMGKT